MGRWMHWSVLAAGLAAGVAGSSWANDSAQPRPDEVGDVPQALGELRDEVRGLRRELERLTRGLETRDRASVEEPVEAPTPAGDETLPELVRRFNALFVQRRYAEAEVVAKQARALAPESPVAELMFWKARFARRETESHSARALSEVDEAGSPAHPETWDQLATPRIMRSVVRNRRPTDEEKRLAAVLKKPVSLHFDKTPLHDVVKHLATEGDVNVVLDRMGLADVGATSDTPVTVHADGIMLQSALHLILKPLALEFSIEDEVLKITSPARQRRARSRTAPAGEPEELLLSPPVGADQP